MFGLSAIINTPEDHLPKAVNEKLPGIMGKLTVLTSSMYFQRLDRLEGNQSLAAAGAAKPKE